MSSADTEAERNALKEHVYPKLRDFCRENYGIEFQVGGGIPCFPARFSFDLFSFPSFCSKGGRGLTSRASICQR